MEGRKAKPKLRKMGTSVALLPIAEWGIGEVEGSSRGGGGGGVGEEGALSNAGGGKEESAPLKPKHSEKKPEERGLIALRRAKVVQES